MSYIALLRLSTIEATRILRDLKMMLLCLIIGVAAISSVGHISESFNQGLKAQGKYLLGGDILLSINHQLLPDDVLNFLRDNSASYSRTARFSSMVSDVDDVTIRQIAEIKAIQHIYPHIGTIDVNGTAQNRITLNPYDFLAAPAVQDIFALNIGDTLRIGDKKFTFKGVIEHEPDIASNRLEFGPRIIANYDDLVTAGLVQKGSLIRYYYHILLRDGDNVEQFQQNFSSINDNIAYRMRTPDNAIPNLLRFVDRFNIFMILVSLSILLIGGIGVSYAVKLWLDKKKKTLALYKTVGYKQHHIIIITLWQLLYVTLIASGFGAMMGAFAPLLLSNVIEEFFPFSLALSLYVTPLVSALAFGVLTVVIFSIIPLSRAMNIAPILLFKGADDTVPSKISPVLYIILAMSIMTLIGLAYIYFNYDIIIIYFALSIGVASVAFYGLSWCFIALIKTIPALPNSFFMLQKQLTSPFGSTNQLIMALGFGIMVLISGDMIQKNLNHALEQASANDAPTFFLLDIAKDDLNILHDIARNNKATRPVDAVPFMRGHLIKVSNDRVEDITVPPNVEWIKRGDRGITWVHDKPSNANIVAGAWWQGDEERDLVSFDAEAAKAFGLKVGDTITVRVLGVEITAIIANLRDINWEDFGINFVMVFNGYTLQHAPQSYLATTYLPDDMVGNFDADMARQLPSVSMVRMKEVLDQAKNIFNQLLFGVRVLALIAIITSICVLIGILIAEQEKRRASDAIMRILGYTPMQQILLDTVEIISLALLSWSIAAIIALSTSYGVITYFLQQDFIIFYDSLFLYPLLALSMMTLIAIIVRFWSNRKPLIEHFRYA